MEFGDILSSRSVTYYPMRLMMATSLPSRHANSKALYIFDKDNSACQMCVQWIGLRAYIKYGSADFTIHCSLHVGSLLQSFRMWSCL